MDHKDWWKPENLKEKQKNFLLHGNLDTIDTGDDFGSYKIMRFEDDIKNSQIRSHNDIQPSYRVRIIKKILRNKKIYSILDVGCGLGFTTNELKKTFKGTNVTGIDVSEDAIAYANQTFERCKFLCEAIDPANQSQNFKFDLITAFEFYPFTRTGSFDDHVEYISHLTKDLNEQGSLVLFQLWDNPESLSGNYEALQHHFPDLVFKAYDMPIRRIGNYLHSRSFAVFLSEIIRLFLRVITKRRIGKNKLIVVSRD